MIELKNIYKEYPLPGGADNFKVLDGLHLKIEQGESLAIVGPSGCGKSTLLNIVGALDLPTSGQVLLQGKDITKLRQAELAEIRNRKIGFIFQLHYLLPQCTVLENVLVPTLAHRQDRFADREKIAAELLEIVGLKDFMLYQPGHLSVGQRQRVALARALINDPEILLADEPTGSLDEKTSESIVNLLCDLNKNQRVTLIVVTHSADLATKMGRVMNLRNGKLGEQLSG